MRYLIIITAILFAACESVVTIDVPVKPPSLVVNSFFGPDSSVKVYVSESRHILDKASPAVNNSASVELFAGGVSLGAVTSSGEGVYQFSHVPQEGGLYSIKVSAPGFETVSAGNRVPVNVPFTIGDTARTQIGGFESFKAEIRLTDPGSDENYYYLRIRSIFYEYVYDSTGMIIDSTAMLYPVSFYSNDLAEDDASFITDGMVFSDKLFNGKDTRFNVIFDVHFVATDLYIDLFSVSKEYFLYLSSLSSNIFNSGNPFAEPTQVYTNIHGGYGIFAGHNPYRDTLKLQ